MDDGEKREYNKKVLVVKQFNVLGVINIGSGASEGNYLVRSVVCDLTLHVQKCLQIQLDESDWSKI